MPWETLLKDFLRAQYPLQWLGEQLILQSIEFEGNPDATNIRERFVYKHQISSQPAQPESSTTLPPPTAVTTGQQHQVVTAQVAAPAVETTPSEIAVPATADPSQVARVEVAQTEQVQPESSTAVNGTTAHVAPEVQPQDTEMSNAP